MERYRLSYTGKQLKEMSSQDFTKVTGKLPMRLKLQLAIFAGAGDKGVQVYEGKDMANGKFSQRRLDYDELATLLNLLESGKTLNDVADIWGKQ